MTTEAQELNAAARSEDKMVRMGYEKAKCPKCDGTGVADYEGRCCTYCDGKGWDWMGKIQGLTIETYGQNYTQPKACELLTQPEDNRGIEGNGGEAA